MIRAAWMVLLVACSDKEAALDSSAGPPVTPGETGVVTDSQETGGSAGDTGEAWVGAEEPLTSPAEAEDLDPADGAVRVELVAAAMTHLVQAESGALIEVPGYAYNGQTPGPTIRAQRGDTVTVDFTNAMEAETTIHWHGLAVPFEMDGVTWISDPILPGQSFTYSFTVDTPGTFWYHPHFNTNEQVEGGLYGVLIVEDPADPVPDAELVLVIDDWTDPALRHGDGDSHYGSEGHWTVNGLRRPTATFHGGEVVRVRIVNTSNTGYLHLRWPDLRQIGADQGLLAALAEPESVVMTAADRIEAEWRVGEEGFVVEDLPYDHQGGASWEDAQDLLRVLVEAPAPAPEGLDWPFPGGEVSEDPGRTDITWVFSGDLETGVWMMNGEVFPDVTVENLALGQEAIIEVRNLSPTEHPYHLHGMHFEVLSVNGISPARRTHDHGQSCHTFCALSALFGPK